MQNNARQTNQQDREFEEKMIQVSRVSKKTKGGNKMGFSVLMVVGDRKGRVGVGLGKAKDVSAAMKKGVKKAKKKMITVPMNGTTIPFSVTVKKGAGVVLLKPAPKGSGVIAGGPVRAVVDAAGIRDISSKIMGSDNQASSVYATFEALKQIQRLVALRNIKFDAPEEVAEKTEAEPVSQSTEKKPTEKPAKQVSKSAAVKPATTITETQSAEKTKPVEKAAAPTAAKKPKAAKKASPAKKPEPVKPTSKDGVASKKTKK